MTCITLSKEPETVIGNACSRSNGIINRQIMTEMAGTNLQRIMAFNHSNSFWINKIFNKK